MGVQVSPAIVGALQCQRNSFLKKFATVVVSCEEDVPAESPRTKKKGKTEPLRKKFAVELEDTILFPEGGGQPSDQGFIVDSHGERHFVDYIKRDKLRALHLVEKPLPIGEKVELELDWKRRFDHMQQHTGQHLLSAVLDKYDTPTLSWSMGDMVNYIEVGRTIPDEEVEKISEEVNERILDAINISVEIPHKDNVNKQKMPDDYDTEKGILRVIKIGELDANPCCGTHLTSTAQIVSIALLHQTSVRGTNSRLHFIAGDRVRQYALNSHKILKQSCADLSCQFDDLTEKINLLNTNYRKVSKKELQWKEEVAGLQSQQILAALKSKDFTFLHRPDAGLEYLTLISKIVSKEITGDKVLVLLSGEGPEGGSVVILSSEPAKSLEIGKHLQTLITELKGGGKGKWQGKIGSYKKGELEAAIQYLESL